MNEKTIKEYSQENIEGLSSLLELFAIPGKIRVYNISNSKLDNHISTESLINEEDCNFLGECEISNWKGLVKIIGDKETEINKKEYEEYESLSNKKLNKKNSIVFLYSEGIYVFSYLL